MTTHLTLAELRYGHEYEGNALNCRVPPAPEDPSLDELSMSVRLKGLIEPLVAVERAGNFYVVAGGRRLAALNRLLREGHYSDALQVEVSVRDESDAEALETSLMENTIRENLHPVDEYEQFVELTRRGMTAADIALRRGISDYQVQQRLALGALAPVVRTAWRVGNIDDKTARAFTVAPDHALQERVMEQLVAGRAYDGQVRQLMGLEQAGRELTFVGRDAYLAAGGHLHRDLFDEKDYVADKDLLGMLVAAKLTASCQALCEDGWGWALPRDQAGSGSYSWAKMARGLVEPVFTDDEVTAMAALDPDEWDDQQKAEAIREQGWLRALPADDKASAGVIVHVDHDGQLSCQYGLYKPGEAPATNDSPADADAEDDGPGPVPRVAVDSTRALQTAAIAKTVSDDPLLAKVLLCATLMHRNGGSPLCLTGNGAECAKGAAERFGSLVGSGVRETMANLMGLSDAKVDEVLAAVVAESIDSTSSARSTMGGWSKNVSDHVVRDVVGACGAAYVKAARATFDPLAYFDLVKKGHALAVIEECRGGAMAKQWGGRKKGEVARVAADVARSFDWLPPDLRGPGYSLNIPDPPIGGSPGAEQVIPPEDVADLPKPKGRGKAKGMTRQQLVAAMGVGGGSDA